MVDDFVEMLRLDQEGMEQALEISEIKKKNQEDGDGFVSTKIREHALMSRLLKNPSVVGCDSWFFFAFFLKELEQQHLVEYKLKKDQDMLVCHASDFEDV